MTKEKIKVLVVDDDRRMVKTVCDILTVKGYLAIGAFSGEEAVEKVREERPDCVLMDVKMPGLSGIEAVKAVKKLAPDTPVVMMSAYATDEQAEEAKRQGAYAVLTKPVDLQQVLSFFSLLRKEESLLVVDDDLNFSLTLKDILEARGYRVETESDPDKVLERMDTSYKLTVLLDLRLGSVDGLDVMKKIRRRYPTKPVVLITGYKEGMGASIEQGLQIGAYACFYKPMDIEKLLGTIGEISRGKLRAVLGEPFQPGEKQGG